MITALTNRSAKIMVFVRVNFKLERNKDFNHNARSNMDESKSKYHNIITEDQTS